MKRMNLLYLTLLWIPATLYGQKNGNATLPYGDMDRWVTRRIHESKIIGGQTKLLYELGPEQTIEENKAYSNLGGSPWGSSNVMARVSGITKTNTSVFPEKRDSGYCARMETRMEGVKVLGLVNINVLAAGSIFLGTMQEPVTSTKNPQKMIDSGIEFPDKPKAIRFDYKIRMSGERNRIRATGFSRKSTVEGTDYPAAILLLQRRWEDEDGNIYAHRVGTMVMRFDCTTDWQNGAIFPILYGDITGHPSYREEWMRIQVEERYARNSKGESVPIKETGWGKAEDTPTHMILQFTSSHGGAYIGSPGNTMWIDNVGLIY